jgi:hypothetical protein
MSCLFTTALFEFGAEPVQFPRFFFFKYIYIYTSNGEKVQKCTVSTQFLL